MGVIEFDLSLFKYEEIVTMTLRRFLLIAVAAVLVPAGSAWAFTETQFNSPDVMIAQRPFPTPPDFDDYYFVERSSESGSSIAIFRSFEQCGEATG